jgi:outer membrane protein TolC
MKKIPPGISLLTVACAIALGCSSVRERDGIEAYREIGRETYGIEGRHPSPKPPLPILTAESTLEDYLRYAALNNPGLEAAFNRWKAALEKIPQARALPDPRFNYGWFIESVETRVGPQKNRFGWYQTFPWIQKLMLQDGMAVEAAESERQKYEAEKLKLFYRVKDTYYDYYYLSRAIKITGENRDLLKDFEEIARVKYSLGTGSHPDVIKAQVELGNVEDRFRSLEDLIQPTVARLNAALNRPMELPLPAPKNIPENRFRMTDKQLLAWLGEANPELKALELDAEKERKGISLARQQIIPDVTLGFEWIDTGRGPQGVSDSGKDPLVANASINLPIWYEKYKAAEREARARFLDAQQRLADRKNNLAAELQLALYNYRDAERKIDLYGNTLIPKGKESLKATVAAYRTGQLDFLNLIDAQRILLEFRLSNERALADRAKRVAEIEKLTGREMPDGRLEPADSNIPNPKNDNGR